MAKSKSKPKTAHKSAPATGSKKAGVPARKPAKQSRPPRVKTTKAAKAGALAKARPATKQAVLIARLRRKEGATLADLVTATGWQAHSVRGAISGTLKKKLGLNVTSEKFEERGRVYRIVGGR